MRPPPAHHSLTGTSCKFPSRDYCQRLSASASIPWQPILDVEHAVDRIYRATDSHEHQRDKFPLITELA